MSLLDGVELMLTGAFFVACGLLGWFAEGFMIRIVALGWRCP